MPPLTRWYIKSALVYFVLAALVGILLMARWAVPGLSDLGAFQPVYFHLLMVGWVSQLIFGVVYWMFPKFSSEQPRGSERLGWVVYVSLNLGLLLRAVGEPAVVLWPERPGGWLLVLSAGLQLVAAWGFIAHTWGRVK